MVKKYIIKKISEADAGVGDNGPMGSVITTDNISNPAYSPVMWNKPKNPDLEESDISIEIPGEGHSVEDEMASQDLSVSLAEGGDDITYGLENPMSSTNSLNEPAFDTFRADSSDDISKYGITGGDFNDLPGMKTPNSLASDIHVGYELIPKEELQMENNQNYIKDLSKDDPRFITLFDEFLDTENSAVDINQQQKPYSQVFKTVDPESYKLGLTNFINQKQMLIDEDSVNDIKFDFENKSPDKSPEELDTFESSENKDNVSEDLVLGSMTNAQSNLRNISENVESYDAQLGFTNSQRTSPFQPSVLLDILSKAINEYSNIINLPPLNNDSAAYNAYGLLRNYLIKLEQSNQAGKLISVASSLLNGIPPKSKEIFIKFLSGEFNSSVAIQLLAKAAGSAESLESTESVGGGVKQVEITEDTSFIAHIENMVKDLGQFDPASEQYLNYSKGLDNLLSEFVNSIGDEKLNSEIEIASNESVKEILELLRDKSITKEDAFKKLLSLSKTNAGGSSLNVNPNVVEEESSSNKLPTTQLEVNHISSTPNIMGESMKTDDKNKKPLYESISPTPNFVGNFYEVYNGQGKFLDFGMAKEVTSSYVKINGKNYPINSHTFFGLKGY